MFESPNVADIKFEESRRKILAIALERLKTANQGFMHNFQREEIWSKVYNGLINHGLVTPLKELMELRLCDPTETQKSMYSPFEGKPFVMCYNKINNQKSFLEQATLNAILYYDQKTLPNADWNNLEFSAVAHVRALKISGICAKGNRECLEKQLRERVLSKDRFGSAPLDFQRLIEKGLVDMAPLSNLRN